MANEMVRAYGTMKTLEANGGSITNNAIVQADDASYSVAADGSNYPHAKFVASFTFGTAPTEGTTLALVARLLDIDGTNDALAPEATRPDRVIGSFVVDNINTIQYAECFAFDLPDYANYYLWNNATGQTVSAGWTLKVTPMTYKPAA